MSRSVQQSSFHFGPAYEEHAVLRDGTRVTLRVVRPQDKEILRRGFERLSPESRYWRFFSAKSRLTDTELRYLTECDGMNHFALGAIHKGVDGIEEGLGIARFVRFRDKSRTAEPAIAVLDDFQGKGLGRLLFVRLVAAARERGIDTFHMEVLAENKVMRDLVKELAPHAHSSSKGAVVSIDLELPDLSAEISPETEKRHGPFYQLFSLAAAGRIAVREVVDRITRQLERYNHNREKRDQ